MWSPPSSLHWVWLMAGWMQKPILTSRQGSFQSFWMTLQACHLTWCWWLHPLCYNIHVWWPQCVSTVIWTAEFSCHQPLGMKQCPFLRMLDCEWWVVTWWCTSNANANLMLVLFLSQYLLQLTQHVQQWWNKTKCPEHDAQMIFHSKDLQLSKEAKRSRMIHDTTFTTWQRNKKLKQMIAG